MRWPRLQLRTAMGAVALMACVLGATLGARRAARYNAQKVAFHRAMESLELRAASVASGDAQVARGRAEASREWVRRTPPASGWSARASAWEHEAARLGGIAAEHRSIAAYHAERSWAHQPRPLTLGGPMRLPRTRLTVRWLMVAVAITAAVAGLVAYPLSCRHQMFLRGRDVYEMDARKARELAERLERGVGCAELMEQMDWKGSCAELARYCRATAARHDQQAARYARAARRPWLPLPASPPMPKQAH